MFLGAIDMGWSGGSTVLAKIAESAIKHFDNHNDACGGFHQRVAFYLDVIEILEDEDADTLDECFDQDRALDRALTESGYQT